MADFLIGVCVVIILMIVLIIGVAAGKETHKTTICYNEAVHVLYDKQFLVKAEPTVKCVTKY